MKTRQLLTTLTLGLGLTLVRDLVTLLDGELSITSDAGRGTTVEFDIPVQTL